MKDFTKRISGLLIAVAIAGFASGAVQVRHLEPQTAGSLPKEGAVTMAPGGMKANRYDAVPAKVKRDAHGMTYTVLIEEDFSKLTEGSIQEPDDEPLCYYYGEPGMNIDPKYTSQPGWTGSNGFSAGGAILMKEVNAQTGAPLNTPLGDYSGNLTISFRYRILPGYDKHSQVFVDVLKGGVEHPQMAECDGNFFSCDVYPGQEDWKWAEITCKNLSADNDGFIQFNCYGAIILDDIEIKSANDFIASPVLKPVTDFSATSFTANWEPVRLASFYYIELQKKVYTSDEENVVYNEDFEDMTSVPEGWTINNFSTDRIVNDGQDGTKGLRMDSGDYIETPDNMAKYHWLKMFGHLVVPEDFDVYNITGTVTFYLRTENGWKQLSSASAGWFYDPWAFDFGADLYPDFNNNYYGVKIEVSGLAEGTYMVFDDFEFETGRPARLEPVISLDDYESVDASNISYTFTNLDPETEYYYGIVSFYQGIYSEPAREHAFGVAAPELLTASGMTESSYTANWQTAPKATGYLATNYGLFEAQEDIAEYMLLEEDFSKITSEVTWGTSLEDAEKLENYTTSSLDAYTLLPGWQGRGNTLIEGGLGVEDSMGSMLYIETPPLTLNNADNFVLGLTGQTLYDDELVVWVNEKAYRLPVSAGDFSGEFVIPEHGGNMTLLFYTANGSPFCFQYVSVAQDLKKGQKVYTYLGCETVSADTTSATFSSLTDEYPMYAYDVKSIFEYDGQTTYSVSDEKILVDLKNGTSISGIEEISADNANVIWYSIEGHRLSQPQPGICIAKFTDGTAKKVIIRR